MIEITEYNIMERIVVSLCDQMISLSYYVEFLSTFRHIVRIESLRRRRVRRPNFYSPNIRCIY